MQLKFKSYGKLLKSAFQKNLTVRIIQDKTVTITICMSMCVIFGCVCQRPLLTELQDFTRKCHYVCSYAPGSISLDFLYDFLIIIFFSIFSYFTLRDDFSTLVNRIRFQIFSLIQFFLPKYYFRLHKIFLNFS